MLIFTYFYTIFHKFLKYGQKTSIYRIMYISRKREKNILQKKLLFLRYTAFLQSVIVYGQQLPNCRKRRYIYKKKLGKPCNLQEYITEYFWRPSCFTGFFDSVETTTVPRRLSLNQAGVLVNTTGFCETSMHCKSPLQKWAEIVSWTQEYLGHAVTD